MKPSALKYFCDLQIGGVKAPSPVGDLGNVEMTQAMELSETRWECIGRDMLLTGESGNPGLYRRPPVAPSVL